MTNKCSTSFAQAARPFLPYLSLLLLLACETAQSGSDSSSRCGQSLPVGCFCSNGLPSCPNGSGGMASGGGLVASGGVVGSGGSASGGLLGTGGLGPATGASFGSGGQPSGGASATGGVGSGAAFGSGGMVATGGFTGGSDVGASMTGGMGSGGMTATGDTVVDQHGALKVQGNRVVDASGQPMQLRGMSLFWSQWTDFYQASTVDVLVDDWGATLVRAALGVENDSGYLQDAGTNEARVRTVVDRAIERGVYVIIDWHDHHAQSHQTEASAFFKKMAQAYGDEPAVLFEIYNEPMDVDWPTVKTYANSILQTIRAEGARNLVIVGTPNWSQDVDVAANDPITGDNNVAYTLHFYANTHRQYLRDKAKTALDRGIPLFVTEWGTCSADGNGSIDAGESQTWLDFLARHEISWANWALNNKDEACSALTPSASSMGPWPQSDLTSSGQLVRAAIP